MLLSEVKKFVGQVVCVSYRERSGAILETTAEIYDIGFVPLYGPCLITDAGEIRLDRLVECSPAELRHAA